MKSNTSNTSTQKPRSRAMSSVAVALAVATLSMATPRPARAYDVGLTHLGLAERSALDSSLHRVLRSRFGVSLGLFAELTLDRMTLNRADGTVLLRRLRKLDPSQGVVPDDAELRSSLSAIGWLLAGAALEQVPPHRVRNHYFNPASRGGLQAEGIVSGMTFRLLDAFEMGGTLGGIITGSNFDLSGQSLDAWVDSPANEHGLGAFYSHMAQSALAPEPAARQTHLVLALISLGAMLNVVADAGSPERVRNDFAAHLVPDRESSSTFDRISTFEQYVQRRYGRSGIGELLQAPVTDSKDAPAAKNPLPSFARARHFLLTGDSAMPGAAAPLSIGLINYTWPRFFSAGTLPDRLRVPADADAQSVATALQKSLRLPSPRVGAVDLVKARSLAGAYVVVDGRRIARYRLVDDRLTFDLDEACYADAAKALLPRVVTYGTGFIEHVLRPELTVQGGALRWNGPALRSGRLTLVVEDGAGRRKVVAERSIPPLRPGQRMGIPRVALGPDGKAQLAAAVVEGETEAGDPVAAVLSRPQL